MPLKRLDIQGFKSFADKTEFLFNNGVNIVVGPNGSGKSNIADSIRWVLGEQSAKNLRGAKMEDIIFAGSDKRKPVGMSEVSLTLDNSKGIFPIEFNEVTVTRRVFRSGESDYLINKTPCRLKDIHELLTDTGIGKEGYSIIGQGKIDEILSTKSEDRRLLIEEAAGIVKYRNRKAEAVRKLNDTEQNLTRIHDIISELETQVGPLAEQAEEAQQYLDFKDELNGLEINLLINQLEEMKDKTKEAKDATASLKVEVAGKETLHATQESKIEELRLLVNKLDEEISGVQQRIYDLGSEIEKKESSIKIAEERTHSLEDQKTRLQKEIALLKEKLDNLQQEFAVDETKLQQLQQKIHNLTTMVTTKDKEKFSLEEAVVQCQNLIESYKNDIFDLLNQIANKKNEINNLAQDNTNSDRKDQQLAADIEKISAEIEANHEKVARTQKQITDFTNRVSEIEQTLRRSNEKRTDLKNWLDTVNKQIEEINNKTQQNKSRQRVLNEMQQHYEGFQKGVKEVLLAAKNDKLMGICGVVAELIKVPSDYETAIEVVLGGALQNVIAETDTNAKDAIEFLKKNSFGRSTFLPLNSINPNSPREDERKASKMPGALGFAADLVTFDQKFKKIFDYLLGRTVVVSKVDDAVKIARECHYRVRLVTLEGDIISPGGSLTGGSYSRKGTNLLGRNREIETLGKVINELNDKRQELDQQNAKITAELANLEINMQSLQQENQQIIIDKAALTKDLEQIEQEQNRFTRELDVNKLEKEQLNTDIEQIKEKDSQLKIELTQLESKDAEIKNNIETKQNELNNLMTQSSSVNQELTATKVELASIQQEFINQEQSLAKYHQTKNEYINNLAQQDTEIKDIDEKVSQLAVEIEQLHVVLKASVEQKKLLEEQLQETRNNRYTNHQELTVTEGLSKDLQKELAKIQDNLRSAEVKEARLEMEAENFMQRLTDEHGLTYEEALLMRTNIENRKEVTGRIRELKDLINDLGVVNIGAIEEYTRVKERFDFLSKQYNDLEEARQSLYKVIAEMDEIMIERFSESFAVINKNFGEVFAELFGGGRAELQLTDVDNLLDTGVEIIAQPPGKKPQHLSLLSGGERALTAIALLFAILKVKPSPFCVLDEIEAALDDANVHRFADFLKVFSTQTQFIVISHRKGTMEAADVLYGVTIDENGVSKLVSMKFSDDEKEKVS